MWSGLRKRPEKDKIMKITPITGNRYYEEEEDYQILIFLSGTRGYWHVVIDSAFQDNEYFHLTKEQLESKFKGIKVSDQGDPQYKLNLKDKP